MTMATMINSSMRVCFRFSMDRRINSERSYAVTTFTPGGIPPSISFSFRSDDNGYDDELFDESMFQILDGSQNQFGAIVRGDHLHSRRKSALNIFQLQIG